MSSRVFLDPLPPWRPVRDGCVRSAQLILRIPWCWMKFGNGSGIASPRGICTWPTLKFVANKRPHFKKHRSTLSLSGLWSKYKLSAPAQHGIWLGGCGLHIGLHVYKDSLSLNIVSLSGHHGSQFTIFYLCYGNPIWFWCLWPYNTDPQQWPRFSYVLSVMSIYTILMSKYQRLSFAICRNLVFRPWSSLSALDHGS